ncbi:hypothetical protein C2U53_26535 [Citrobacter sp. CFNIH10]|nr:hypothetical protein C2U53_26535 [Citrobacter sp. CFNIH10]MBY5256662.1 hypothetical protein [Citrobacter amalonaticus]
MFRKASPLSPYLAIFFYSACQTNKFYIFYEFFGNLTNPRLSVIMKAGKDTRLILRVLTVESVEV